MMIDREIVMSWLEKLAQNDWRKWYNDSDVQATAQAALTLFREQEPVMPELRMTRHGFRQWVVCGNCYGKIDGGDDYCRHCGRKVVWND